MCTFYFVVFICPFNLVDSRVMLSVAVFSAGLKRVPVGFLFNKGRRLVDVYFHLPVTVR